MTWGTHRRSIAVAAVATTALALPVGLATSGAVAAPTPKSSVAGAPRASRAVLPGEVAMPRGMAGAGAVVIPTRKAPAGADKLVGNHKIYFAPASWTDTKPPQDPEAGAGDSVAASNDYWHQVDPSMSVSLGWTHDWFKISLSSSEVARCDKAALVREALKLVKGGGYLDHVLVNLPYNSACGWTDLEWMGLSPNGFGLTLTNGLIVPKADVINRAIMHNDWVFPTDGLLCKDGSGRPVPLSDSCTKDLYSDPWSPASVLPYDHTGVPHAVEQWWLGTISDGGVKTVVPGVSTYVTIPPLENTSGVRDIRFTLDDYRYDLEYRYPTGLDSWTNDQSYTDGSGTTRTTPGGGVILTRQKIVGKTYYASELIDFHPAARQSDTRRHPGLESGESYTAPNGLFSIKVGYASSSGANVTVSFPGLGKVARYAGEDRFATAATVSAKTFPSGAKVAYLAAGYNFPDALSGAPVAGMTKGPILLTRPDELPSSTASELRRLHADKLVVLGGTSVVSDAIAEQAAAAGGSSWTRWSGPERYATSAQISAKSFAAGSVETVFLASGLNYPDALAGAPVGGKWRSPVLLTDPDRLPSVIADEIVRLRPKKIIALGGPDVVASAVLTGAAHLVGAGVDRWSGDDRFGTAADISRNAYTPPVGTVYLASGWDFADALSGAPAAGATRNPVLLVSRTSLPSTIAAELRRLRPAKVVILGGPDVVGYTVEAAAGTYLR